MPSVRNDAPGEAVEGRAQGGGKFQGVGGKEMYWFLAPPELLNEKSATSLPPTMDDSRVFRESGVR